MARRSASSRMTLAPASAASRSNWPRALSPRAFSLHSSVFMPLIVTLILLGRARVGPDLVWLSQASTASTSTLHLPSTCLPRSCQRPPLWRRTRLAADSREFASAMTCVLWRRSDGLRSLPRRLIFMVAATLASLTWVGLRRQEATHATCSAISPLDRRDVRAITPWDPRCRVCTKD